MSYQFQISPTDYQRNTVKCFDGDRVYFTLDHALSKEAIDFSSFSSVTPFMFFLSLWMMLVARYSNQEDVIIGIPTAGRTRKELSEIIGMFVNMLPVRGILSGDKSFKKLLTEVKNHVLNILKISGLPI